MANISRSRKSGFTLRGGVMRRETLWFGNAATNTTLTAGGGSLLTSLNAAALALRPFTIIRTRGMFHVESDQSAASEKSTGAFGAVIVEEEASGAGVGSLPRPITEVDASWFVYQSYVNNFVFATSVGFVEGLGAGFMQEFDSKAMRKVGLSNDVVIVGETSSGVGAVFTIEGRMLIKLH